MTKRDQVIEECAAIADLWAKSRSCVKGEPCEHVRLAKEIARRIRVLKESKWSLTDWAAAPPKNDCHCICCAVAISAIRANRIPPACNCHTYSESERCDCAFCRHELESRRL